MAHPEAASPSGKVGNEAVSPSGKFGNEAALPSRKLRDEADIRYTSGEAASQDSLADQPRILFA